VRGRDVAGKLDGGRGFEQRVQRSTEKTRLLSRDDGDGGS
jgi:hypothetical protein